jgi:MinD-like ATPase involved in chromosome partitioning or flagellar assembly
VLETLVRSIQAARHQSKSTEPQLISVTSPHGSTGKTTIAINIALELAAEKYKVILIDADLAGPSVANYFCLSELPAGLAGALRIASQNRFDKFQLERLSVQVPKSSIVVLPGAMAELTVEPTEKILSAIKKVAKEAYDFVIVDLGSVPTTAKIQEFNFTRAWIQQADQLVLVASADPVGIFRLLAIEASILELTTEPILVINRLRNSVIPQAKSEIKATLSKLGSIEVAAFLPDDPIQVDQATRDGMAGGRSGRAGSLTSSVAIFTRSAILGRPGALDARVAKLG